MRWRRSGCDDLHVHFEEISDADEPAPDIKGAPASEADENAGPPAPDPPADPASPAEEPHSTPLAPGAFVGRSGAPFGDRFKSGLARLAAKLADSATQPSGRSVEDRGLAIPRHDAGIHRSVGGIQPGLQSRIVTDDTSEALTREVEEQALAVVMAAELTAGRDPAPTLRLVQLVQRIVNRDTKPGARSGGRR